MQRPIKAHLQAIRASLPAFGLLLIMLLLAACTGSERMRHDLAALQQRNQADSLLTDSVLAMRLADYFDRHGTQNERLEAHYLLARTWADLGQAPRALDAFHHAASLADTTRLDSLGCHHLSRIYGQMGELLYSNQLPYNALHCFKRAYRYAHHIHEHTIAAHYRAHQFMCYYHLNQPDSALIVAENSRALFLELGDTLTGNTYGGPLAYMYMTQKNNYAKAEELLSLYENHSLLDRDDIQRREEWKLLYIYKGYYQLGVNNPDSSLYYFYRAVRTAMSANIVGQGYEGLAKAYYVANQPDSAGKYARLAMDVNDSVFKFSMSSALLSIHHLYDYSWYQNETTRKTIEANNAKSALLLLSITLPLFVTVGLLVFVRFRDRTRLIRHKMNAKYVSDILRYRNIQTELRSIKEQSEADKKQIASLEEALSYLKRNIPATANRFDIESWNIEENLLNTMIVKRVKVLAAKGRQMTDSDWMELRKAVNAYLPGFIEKLSGLCPNLSLVETQICILSKLKFSPTETGMLTGKNSSALANSRRRLLRKVFGEDGSPQRFDERIRLLSCENDSVTP